MLDINTEKGQKSLEWESLMINRVSSKWNNINLIETKKDEAAVCDGVIVQNNIITGIFESKCRNMSYEQLTKFGTWLITFEKLEKCRRLTEDLKVIFIGFLYLIPSDQILYWKIAENGKYCFSFETHNTLTQRTINGGETIRLNAFLPLSKSKIL